MILVPIIAIVSRRTTLLTRWAVMRAGIRKGAHERSRKPLPRWVMPRWPCDDAQPNCEAGRQTDNNIVITVQGVVGEKPHCGPNNRCEHQEGRSGRDKPRHWFALFTVIVYYDHDASGDQGNHGSRHHPCASIDRSEGVARYQVERRYENVTHEIPTHPPRAYGREV